MKTLFFFLFTRPKSELKKLMPELREFANVIYRASRLESLDGIVTFFDQVSVWHDRSDEISSIIEKFKRANYGQQYNQIIENLSTLEAHFYNAGREQFGWNRTMSGEKVTEEKVYLGNIFGLFTHPVSFWKRKKDEKKGGWGFPNMEHLNAYDVVSRQARGFINSHVDSMTTCVTRLTTA